MYNYFFLVGRLTRDAEVVEYPEGKRVVKISLAVNRSFKNSKGEVETDFFNISIWDFLVDFVLDNLKTGMAVGVKGRIQNSSWDVPNFKSITMTNLIGDKVVLFTSPGELNQLKNEEF